MRAIWTSRSPPRSSWAKCTFSFPRFGCLDLSWSPDLDAELLDPNGAQISLSQCMDGDECGFGRQETLHAMPTVAGTYEIRVYAYLGSPNDGQGGPFGMDLSRGRSATRRPASAPPPPPSVHVGDLDSSSLTVTSRVWRARVTITVHDGGHALVAGAVVRVASARPGAPSPATGAGGWCTLTRDLQRSKTNILFTVLDVTKPGSTSQLAADHDPDDSDGTRITATRP